MPIPPPHSDASDSLSERERKVARRVRRALHLSPSMSEEEVAAEFYGSFVWRRERMAMTSAALRASISEAFASAWARLRAGLGRLLGEEDAGERGDPSR